MKKAILMGYDWGGGIAMSYTANNYNIISKNVLFMPS